MKLIEAYESSGDCHEMSPIMTPIFKSTLKPQESSSCHSYYYPYSYKIASRIKQPAMTHQGQVGELF